MFKKSALTWLIDEGMTFSEEKSFCLRIPASNALRPRAMTLSRNLVLTSLTSGKVEKLCKDSVFRLEAGFGKEDEPRSLVFVERALPPLLIRPRLLPRRIMSKVLHKNSSAK